MYGVLEFSDKVDTKLGARNIIVLGGKIVIGWKELPLVNNKARIILTGSRDNREEQVGEQEIVGSKVSIFSFSKILLFNCFK